MPKIAGAASNRVVDISTVAGVDPTGNSSSWSAFNTAFTELESRGGGELYIPPGTYLIDQPLSYSGNNLSIFGCGQTLSVFLIKTSFNVFTFDGSASPGFSLTMKDLGFAAAMSPAGGTAITIKGFSPVSPTTQTCLIENVDFSVLYPNYTAFQVAISLSYVNRANFRNLNYHSGVGTKSGSFFATLSQCIDTRFSNCSIDGIDNAFYISGYSEGLHIVDTVIAAGNCAIFTGSTLYGNNINLLGLYVSNCEFNTTGSSALLYYVNSGYISNTHFSTATLMNPALVLGGCALVQVNNCEFTGQFSYGAPAAWTGISLGPINQFGSTANILDGCLFSNLGIGLELLPGGCTYNTAVGLRFIDSIDLVGNPENDGGFSIQAYVDYSGNTTNEVQTVAGQPGTGNTTTHVIYSH